MIVLWAKHWVQPKSKRIEDLDTYWACEHCGASDDGNAPAGKLDHRDTCPEKTWERRTGEPPRTGPTTA